MRLPLLCVKIEVTKDLLAAQLLEPGVVLCFDCDEKFCIISFQKALFYQQKLMGCGIREVTFKLYNTIYGFFFDK